MKSQHILKNLHSLIRNSAMQYMNEFIWQDIELTKEFETAFTNYLHKNGYDIEFLGKTSVITSSSTKYIYVPNQWFVIASYAVDVYEELYKYKGAFRAVSDSMGRKPDEFSKHLRDRASISDRTVFIDSAKQFFSRTSKDQKKIEEAATRLWRFVSDYAWWSGQKTIDRGDFHVSVILNMLNLVNVSQGYVADIVSAYANDNTLRRLVKTVDAFTTNLGGDPIEIKDDYILPDEEIGKADYVSEKGIDYETIPKPERVRIKISGKNTFKEIKYKG